MPRKSHTAEERTNIRFTRWIKAERAVGRFSSSELCRWISKTEAALNYMIANDAWKLGDVIKIISKAEATDEEILWIFKTR